MTERTCPDKMADTGLSGLAACEDLAAMFRALGHPARIAILRRLAGAEDACCGEIVDALPLAQSTVSQHLQVLKDARLLICDTRGRNCHYHLNWDRLREAETVTGEFWDLLNAARHRGSGGCCGAANSKET